MIVWCNANRFNCDFSLFESTPLFQSQIRVMPIYYNVAWLITYAKRECFVYDWIRSFVRSKINSCLNPLYSTLPQRTELRTIYRRCIACARWYGTVSLIRLVHYHNHDQVACGWCIEGHEQNLRKTVCLPKRTKSAIQNQSPLGRETPDHSYLPNTKVVTT